MAPPAVETMRPAEPPWNKCSTPCSRSPPAHPAPIITASHEGRAAVMYCFTIADVGGGFLAVHSRSAAGTTAGGIRMGVLGKHYISPADAEADARSLAAAMHDKNAASFLPFGGCKTVLYTTEAVFGADFDVPGSARSRLFDGLADILVRPENLDRVLVGPDMGTSRSDLAYLRRAIYLRAPALVNCPVPLLLVSKDEDVVSVSTAWSTCGALLALAEARGWKRPTVAIQGLGNVGGTLLNLLQARGWSCVGYDPVEERMKALQPAARRNSQTILEEECEILVPCAFGNVITPEVVKNLRCKAVAGAANCQIPEGSGSKELLEASGIEYFSESMINVGGVAYASRAFTGEPFTYEDSLELGKKNMRLMMHEASVVTQYDTEEKRAFYAEVMGDGTSNIHFGLWDGVDVEEDGAYGKASVAMTDWMWRKAMEMMGNEKSGSSATRSHVKYIDLGSGNGSAGRHIVGNDDLVSVTCLELCTNQNRENRDKTAALGLSSRVTVEDGSFDRMPESWANSYDGCFSQDAFVHAYSKEQALREACRITKGGGWLVLSDLHCGGGPGVSAEELHTFAQTNMVNDWQTPEEVVATAGRAGWTNVRFVDLTAHIRLSFQLMLKKVNSVIASGKHDGVNIQLLTTYQTNLTRRVDQVDVGVFKWGAILAQKPFEVLFTSPPPVAPQPREMFNYQVVDEDGEGMLDVKPSTDVLVVTIADRVDAAAISLLPPSLRAIVSLSAGLDHVDLPAASAAGIKVLQSGSAAITASVAEYLLGVTILSLRDAYSKMGTPFPSSGWNLSWNAEGIDLSTATVGVIGMGRIGVTFAERLRALSPSTRIVYFDARRRSAVEDARLALEFQPLDTVLRGSDTVVLQCALTEETAGLIGSRELSIMKPTATLINTGRGRIVDTDALTQALSDRRIRHAFLDCTAPEPLPECHKLWKLDNCTIMPHYATNTTRVRSELVADVPRIVEATFRPRQAQLAAEESKLRKDLSVAHIVTRKYGMDELVWNRISARMADGSVLITPGRMLFDEIAPSDILKSSGNVIHSAVYAARPDVAAVVHLHTPATVAVSCLEDGFQALAQEAAYFHGKVAYYEWQGLEDDKAEGPAISEAVSGECNTLVMRNHAFCTFGRTVAEAWVLAYYFDKACATQLAVMKSGGKVRVPDAKVMAHAAAQVQLPKYTPGECEWAGMEKLAARRPY